MSVTGEIVVAGLVTGTHFIEDIGIGVPHQVAVHIPGELALKSKDLWRGIQQKKLFKLDAGVGLHFSASAPAPDTNRVAQLEAENAELRRELETERLRNQGLQDVLAGLQSQLQGVQTALGRLGEAPRVIHVPVGAVPVGAVVDPDVVGGEVPTFLPERIRPEAAEAQIRPATETASGSNVSSAANKLRELKKQSSG